LRRSYSFVIVALLLISSSASARVIADRHRNNQQVERSVAADSRVVVSVCVAAGTIVVQGWDRNEVHARISDGVPIQLARVGPASSRPAGELILTTGESNSRPHGHCLPLGDIQLDVPRGAHLKLITNSGGIRVTDVARVEATSQAGDVTLTKVHGEGDANTIGGEIFVRDSTGSFRLHAVGGQTDLQDLAPATAADVVEAATVSGDVTLVRVAHKSVNVSSVSGDADFAGPLSRGGHYSFHSISGRLRLSVPANSSFHLTGTLGQGGDLKGDFNLHNTATSSGYGPTRPVNALVGSGDASINVSLFSGSIEIRKLIH
jgi:hypothetical protein